MRATKSTKELRHIGIDVRGVRCRQAELDIDRDASGATMVEEEGSLASRGVDSRVIGEGKSRRHLVPVSGVGVGVVAKHRHDGEVEALHPTIRLRVVRCNLYPRDTEAIGKLREECVGEGGAVVGQNLGGDTMLVDHSLEQSGGRSGSGGVRYGNGDSVAGEVVHKHQDIAVTSSRGGRGPRWPAETSSHGRPATTERC